jgi:hypothetical protein
VWSFNPLNAELNPICHLLALLGGATIVVVSRLRVNPLNAELYPICHLLALLGSATIVVVSRLRVKKGVHKIFNFQNSNFQNSKLQKMGGGHAVAKLVEALRYKPEGLGFDSQSYHWNFS